MKIILRIFLTLHLISAALGDFDVTGYSGRSLMLNSGRLWHKNYAKYMHKLPEWKTLMYYKIHEKWINEGRFTLFENSDGNLMIFIRDLHTDDAGVYRIGVYDDWRISLTLNVDEEYCACNVSKRVMVHSGESGSFSCEYSHNHINDEKVVFKEGRDSIEMIYSTLNKKERFSISDDRQRKLFNVSITAVTTDDGGVYLCGVWVNKHSYSYYIINTVHLYVISSCCGSSKTLVVKSREAAAFTCEYSLNQTSGGKTIFKTDNDIFDEVISTTYTWDRKERVSISDDRQRKLLSVSITAVTADDGGVYLCGVWVKDNSYSYYITNTVHLQIITEVGVSTVIGYSGAALMIKCEHPQHKTNNKYICKESSAGCSGEWRKNGDVSVDEDSRAGVLMVFFRELKAADAGTYRCGVKDSEYTERFTQLQLKVRHDEKYPKVVNKTAYPGEVSIICQIPEVQKNNYFCKEHDHKSCQIMRASEEPQLTHEEPVGNEERVFRVSIRDAGVYWCGAETRDTHLTFISLTTKIQLSVIDNGFSRIIIIIGVCAIVLLISGITLTVCKLRHKRRGDATFPPQLPTTPSDGLLYASVSFQKHEESPSKPSVSFRTDKSHCTYATVSHSSN
ncbi:polymeric immunoglobulin receptor-like [Danio rerio]|uniref:polymeric immunoglobulin receptor-like n=1 Tax=Danio rerio TaxID=7955 RepID=UPI003CE48EF4